MEGFGGEVEAEEVLLRNIADEDLNCEGYNRNLFHNFVHNSKFGPKLK